MKILKVFGIKNIHKIFLLYYGEFFLKYFFIFIKMGLYILYLNRISVDIIIFNGIFLWI